MKGFESPADGGAAPATGCWVWPYRVPPHIAARVLARCEGVARAFDRPGLWVPICLAIGALPAGLSYATGVGGAHAATALAAAVLLAGAAVRDAAFRGIAALALIVIAHSAVNVRLAATDPEGLVAVLPAGARYWDESRQWIRTGDNAEYELRAWLPAHVELAGGVTLLGYASLGFTPLSRGLEQVDMMNFYVGQLIVHSRSAWLAAVAGWHPWSVCRGLGCLVLMFETVSFSLQRLTGRTLSPWNRRGPRWAAVAAFFALDAAIKYLYMEDVRSLLAGNLLS